MYVSSRDPTRVVFMCVFSPNNFVQLNDGQLKRLTDSDMKELIQSIKITINTHLSAIKDIGTFLFVTSI